MSERETRFTSGGVNPIDLARFVGGQFLQKDSRLLLPQIAVALLTGGQRNLTADVEKTIKTFRKFENPLILGEENIPCVPSPIIIVGNHTRERELMLALAFLTDSMSRKRQGQGLPTNIRWFMAVDTSEQKQNLWSDLVLDPLRERFIRAYNQIPIPNQRSDNSTETTRGRRLIDTVHYLNENQLGIVGIFPEGANDNKNGGVYDGLGRLVRRVKNEDLKILPVGIGRDSEGQLVVKFGSLIEGSNLKKIPTDKEITEKVQGAVSGLYQIS